MALNKKLLGAVLGSALLLGAAAAAYFTLARPRVELAETLHDFGTVREDQRLSHTFFIKNRGAGVLRIKEPAMMNLRTLQKTITVDGRVGEKN